MLQTHINVPRPDVLGPRIHINPRDVTRGKKPYYMQIWEHPMERAVAAQITPHRLVNKTIKRDTAARLPLDGHEIWKHRKIKNTLETGGAEYDFGYNTIDPHGVGPLYTGMSPINFI